MLLWVSVREIGRTLFSVGPPESVTVSIIIDNEDISDNAILHQSLRPRTLKIKMRLMISSRRRRKMTRRRTRVFY